MQFNHDNMTGVMLAADLVNLASPSGAAPAAGSIWSVGAVAAVLRQHGIRRPQLDAVACEELREWAQSLRSVFSASEASARCDQINRLLRLATRQVFLTNHDGLRPHLHFAAEDEDALGRLRAVTAGGLALFTVEADGLRLGVCDLPACDAVFVDTSRNGTRRYCTARCGNTAAVSRHRRRNASGAAGRRSPRSGSVGT